MFHCMTEYLSWCEDVNNVLAEFYEGYDPEQFKREGFELHPHDIHVTAVFPREHLEAYQQWVDERTQPGILVHFKPGVEEPVEVERLIGETLT